MNSRAKYYIDKLGLLEHPEGGYYREIYRADEKIRSEHLPDRYSTDRNILTSIYFLLEGEDISVFHKLESDELWHFYDGTNVKLYLINSGGELTEILLGRDLEAGEVFQCTIPKHTWFAAEVIKKDSFALFGCNVAPGFDFEDFQIGNREKLIELFPRHSGLLKRLTRSTNGA
ncbi:MAG: cupin domain-containing protein [Ignavibacteriaceae bacterium]